MVGDVHFKGVVAVFICAKAGENRGNMTFDCVCEFAFSGSVLHAWIGAVCILFSYVCMCVCVHAYSSLSAAVCNGVCSLGLGTEYIIYCNGMS